MTFSSKLSPSPTFLPCFLFLYILIQLMICRVTAEFEPYQMNGGLIAACAGRDFVILASDTRLMGEGGYDILSRTHTSSRIWTVKSHDDEGPFPVNPWNSDGSLRFLESSALSSFNKETRQPPSTFSIPLPSKTVDATSPLKSIASSTYLSEDSSNEDPGDGRRSRQISPVVVGSSGCSADCEMLKRTIRADVRAHGIHVRPSSMAVLLSQTLYQRRTFPFYSFCVLAGIEHEGSDGGHVYAYDAIGSYERVAVATAGQSRDLLQPILDRKFTSLRHESPFHVQCSKEQAMDILVDAYRSVAERHIDVGDNIVFCILSKGNENGDIHVETLYTELKEH